MRIKLSALGADSSSLGSTMSLQLPVVIGRSSTSDQLVAKDAEGGTHPLPFEDGKASREHLMIEESGGRIMVTDRSRNGSYMVTDGVSRRLTNRMAEPLPDHGGMLRINTCDIMVEAIGGAVSDLFVQIQSPSGTVRDLDLGAQALVVGVSDNRLFLKPDQAPGADAELTASEPGWCMALTASASNGAIQVRGDGPMSVQLNRVQMSRGTVEANHLDVIEVGGHRMTILQHGAPQGSVCPNPTCKLLNPVGYVDNCRFCGAKLDNAETFVVRG